MRIEGSNATAANFNFQVEVRAEEKESKNLFAVIKAAKKRESNHHSLRN
jgi:hypothetical protein